MPNQISSITPEALNKQQKVIDWFACCHDEQARYQKIIELGAKLPPFPQEHKTAKNIVSGCQSIVYLHCSQKEDGKLYFEASSEALISSGLAMLALSAYSGLLPEEILQTPANFVEELGLGKSLTPGRSNGLLSMLTLIKQKSLLYYLKRQNLS